MARRAFLLAFAVPLLAPLASVGQPAPVAAPFLVDPSPELETEGAAVGVMADGRSIVVWKVPRTYGYKVFARTFDAAGLPGGAPILLSGPRTYPGNVAVAPGAADTWIVVWDDNETGLVGRRLDAGDGTPLGKRFRITRYPVSSDGPALCSDAAGRFVVAWMPFTTAGDLFAARYDAEARRLGGEVAVARNAHRGAGVACAPDGRFAVGWIATTGTCLAAVYDANGRREGSTRRTGARRVDFTVPPRLAMAPGGELAVAWDAPLRVRFFAAAGQPLGPPHDVAQAPTFFPYRPREVVTLSASTFLMLWSEPDFSLPSTPISSQLFDAATGRPQSGPRRIAEAWGRADQLRAGSDLDGRLALAWGPYAQLFDAVDPGLLELDRPWLAAGEADGEIVFNVRRVGGSGGDVDVGYAVVPVTTEPEEDFEPASGTLSFPAGDSQPRTVRVRLVDDAEPEAEETLAIELSSPAGGAGLGTVTRTELAIRDDEEPPPLRPHGAPIEVSSAAALAATPAAAVAADGSFAVAWSQGYTVLAQRFTSSGAPLELGEADIGSELPALAAHPDGGFSLVWQHNSYVGLGTAPRKHGYGAAQLYLQHAPAHGPWGAPMLIGAGPDVFHGPALTYVDLTAAGKSRLLAGGRFGGDRFETLAFNAAGELLRTEPAVIAGAGDLLGEPAFAVGADRSVLLLAADAFDGSATGIAAVRLRPNGTRRGKPFAVNVVASGSQEGPDVAAFGDGRFLAVWRSVEQPDDRGHVAGRLLTPAGVPAGPELRVSTSWGLDHRAPKVAALGDGGALVVWEALTADGASEIRAQVVDSSGLLRGRELAIGGLAAGARHQPGVAANAAGQAVVVWLEVDGDGGTAVRLQRLVP